MSLSLVILGLAVAYSLILVQVKRQIESLRSQPEQLPPVIAWVVPHSPTTRADLQIHSLGGFSSICVYFTTKQDSLSASQNVSAVDLKINGLPAFYLGDSTASDLMYEEDRGMCWSARLVTGDNLAEFKFQVLDTNYDYKWLITITE
jgi:hypothetical protein